MLLFYLQDLFFACVLGLVGVYLYDRKGRSKPSSTLSLHCSKYLHSLTCIIEGVVWSSEYVLLVPQHEKRSLVWTSRL